MTIPTQRARLARIASMESEVARLTTVATQKPLIDLLASASRDLLEARQWLTANDAGRRANGLTMVDLTMKMAGWRVEMVQMAIQRYGPHSRRTD